MNKLIEEIDNQINQQLIQGCVCGTLTQSPVAFGLQTVHPVETVMTPHSRFDIASTGKTFTASCCALLATQGKLDPDAPFTEYVPDHVLGKNCEISVRDLATHSGGFTNDKPYAKDNYDDFYREMMQMRPLHKRREYFEYSCYNFIMLGLILNQITGKDLDTLARELLWEPLGMTHTTWNEPGASPLEVEHHFPDHPAGVHNDPVCNLVNRPLGSGSCFSTCEDLLKFVKDLAEQTHFPKEYYRLLTTCTFETDKSIGFEVVPFARRSFGWDMSDFIRPKKMTREAIYHTGWTGQTLAVDPTLGIAGVVMTSRTGEWELSNVKRSEILDLMF